MKLEKLVESSSTIVKGMEGLDREYLTLVANKLREQLGINPSRKIIVNTKQKAQLFGANHNGATIMQNGIIAMFLNESLMNDQMILTMAHEMVHAQHLDSGRMEMNITSRGVELKWEGEQVAPKYSRSAPWEVDAHIKEKKLRDFLLQDQEVLDMREKVMNQ